jgi:hypothetical protein
MWVHGNGEVSKLTTPFMFHRRPIRLRSTIFMRPLPFASSAHRPTQGTVVYKASPNECYFSTKNRS